MPRLAVPHFFLCLVLVTVNGCVSSPPLRIQTSVPTVAEPAFRASLEGLIGVPFLEGNRVTELVNGEQFFPAMLGAISNAQKSISIENFVWRSGQVSDRFIDALSDRARAGVQIHFLLDAVGGHEFERKDRERLEQAGVKIVRFNPFDWRDPGSINHRTHRKTLVVDGTLGFIGGISIADEWDGAASSPGTWRDSNYLLEGPAVAQLQGIFTDNWIETRGEVLAGSEHFPAIPRVGNSLIQCWMSGASAGEDNARLTYMLALSAATNTIRLGHSYFLPDDAMLESLVSAVKRGVKVEAIIPGIANVNFVRRAVRSRLGRVLEAGIQIWEYQPSKYHPKLLIVDDFFVTTGSINLDERSFSINDEANFSALDREFAASQIRQFEADKKLCVPYTRDQLEARSRWTKTTDHMAGWFRSQL